MMKTIEDLADEIKNNAENVNIILGDTQALNHAEAICYLENMIAHLKYKGVRPFTNNCDVLQLIKNIAGL